MSGEIVARIARSWIGTPYRHQASRKGVGCDCLGLIRGVRGELGFRPVPMPAYAPGWGETSGRGEPLLEAARALLVDCTGRTPEAGDVIVFRMIERGPAKHCGIASDAQHFVHAQAGVGTAEVALSEPWARRIAGLFRFPGPIEGNSP